MRIFKNIVYKYRMRKNPAALLRKLGADIGENCEIYPSVNFMEPYLIHIGNNVRLNEGVQLVTHDGGVWVLRNLYPELRDIDIFGEIFIGNNVHVGTNAIVMPGVHIGSNCIIGAGAVVTKNIPDHCVAAGIPAVVIETVEKYKEKNNKKFVHTKNLSTEKKRQYLEEYFSHK